MPSTFPFDISNPYDVRTGTYASLAQRVQGKMQYLLASLNPNGSVAEFCGELIAEMATAVLLQPANAPDSVATTVNISVPGFSLGVGNTVPLTATVLDQFGRVMPDAIVTWSMASGVTSIAAVSPLGVVTGMAPGADAVSAVSGSASALALVTVTGAINHPPTAVLASPASPSFTSPVNVAISLDPTGSFDPDGPWNGTWTVTNAVGTVRFTQTGTMGNLASNKATWTPAVAEQVTITLAVTDGTLVSTISTAGNITAVTLVPTSISMPVNFGLVAGATQTITGQVLDQFGKSMTGQTVTYGSGTPAAATVNVNSGLVTAVAAGSSVITATSGALTGTVTVTVTAAASGGTYPNLPGAMTQLFQYDGNGLPGGGTTGFKTTNMTVGQGSFFAYFAGCGTSPTIGDAPIDASQVLDIKYPTTLGPGNAPVGAWMWANGSFPEYNEYYEAGWFRVGAQGDTTFLAPGTGEWKTLGYWAVGTAPGNAVDNSIYNVLGAAGDTADGSFTFYIREQNVVNWTLAGGTIIVGKWYRYEIRMKKESAPGNADGILQVWLTNITDAGAVTQVINSSNRQYTTSANPHGFWKRTLVPVWGGGGSVAKTRDDHVQFARITGFGK